MTRSAEAKSSGAITEFVPAVAYCSLITSAAEDHKSEHRQFGATGHRRPPSVKPLDCVRFRPPNTEELDCRADDHESGTQRTCEPNAHLIEDDTCDDEESEHVKQILACGIGTKYTLIPSKALIEQGSQRRENIHEHIREEHHGCYKDEHGPACNRFITKRLLKFIYHKPELLIKIMNYQSVSYTTTCFSF